MKTSRIIITPGDPAGVGPDITIKIAQQTWPAAEIIVTSDPDLLSVRAKMLGLPLKLEDFDPKKSPSAHQPGSLKIIPLSLNAQVTVGTLNSANSAYVMQCLEVATDYCLKKITHAMVTGPVSKSIISEAGFDFMGHTEFLAQRCQVSNVVMLFVAQQMKVALLTTHLPLAQVPKAITQEKIHKVVQVLNAELINRFNITHPKILVCGLNPHAGENGHLGREEIATITPALQALRAQHINVAGPLPADTIFTEKYLNETDVILAMYHDQALPVVKYLGFGNAVNITLGLPIIRTSVDHGIALDVAGTNKADAGSLAAAIRLALNLN